jgi:hypothetical protein
MGDSMSSKLKAGTATSGAVIDADTTGILELQTGSTPTTAVTIDTSQNVGIGTSSPSAPLHVAGSSAQVKVSNAGVTQYTYMLRDGYYSVGGDMALYTGGANNQTFWTNATERMRITSAGKVLVGTTTGDEQFIVNCSLANTNAIKFVNSNSSGYGIACVVNNSNTTNRFFEGVDSGPSQRIAIYTNGDVKNTNNSYGSLSDAKLKQDIVDASSQWNDIKNLKVRKYRFKDNPEGQLQIGLIAQEVEPISAGLVSESPDEERDESGSVIGFTGEYTKSIKYSVLYMKAVKALQEAMERIEAIEAKVDAQALEIQALKGTA